MSPQRHNTPVLERAIATRYMFEIGSDEYQTCLRDMQATGHAPDTPSSGWVDCEKQGER